MKKKTAMAAAVSLIAMCGFVSFSGCGSKKITAESLISDAQKKVEAQNSFEGSMDVSMTMSYKQEGFSMDLTMDMDMDIRQTEDPDACYMSGKVSADLLNLSLDMEMYAVEEDGRYVTYTGTAGTWTRTEAEEGDSANITDELFSAANEDIEFTLDENTEKDDVGNELYVLRAEVSGDSYNSILGSMDTMLGIDDSDFDLSSVSADIVYKIDKETGLPASISWDFGDTLSSVAVDEDSGILINACSIALEYDSFGGVDAISVSDDVKEQAVDSSDSSLGTGIFSEEETQADSTADETEAEDETDSADEVEAIVQDEEGNYILEDYDGKIKVKVPGPEGYELAPYADSTYLGFTKTSDTYETVDVFYYVYADYDESYITDQITSREELCQEDESYSETELSDITKVSSDIGEISVQKLSYVYDNDGYYVTYYLWLNNGNGSFIYVEATDYNYQNACAEFTDDSSAASLFFDGVSFQAE